MITVDFEKRGNAGLCEFLTQSLKNQILQNKLSAGEKLPSKRALASHLGISVITVQNAYEQMISEGYIYSIEKKGFFVTDILPNPKSAEGRPSNRSLKKNILTFSEKRDSRSSQYYTDFFSNIASSEKFPFNAWAKTTRQVLTSGNSKLLERQNVFGAWELRKSIASYLREFRNMETIPEQIVIGAGTESLCAKLVQFLGREKVYAVENPGYKKVASVFREEGANCIPISIDGEGMNPELLEDLGISVVHISPTHHYPTGIVTPIRRRMQLLHWATSKPNRYIIEDDYDSEFRFNGKPLPTLQSKDKNGKVIYINTFSKTLAPSFRISYMVLPLNLVEFFAQKFAFASCEVSAFEQFTLAQFIENGHYSKHVIRMKNYFRTMRNNLIQAIEKSRLRNIATIHEEDAGLHFLLNVKTSKDSAEIEAAMSEYKIRIPQLKNYFYEGTGNASSKNGFVFVINYSGIQKDRIKETIKRMERIFL